MLLRNSKGQATVAGVDKQGWGRLADEVGRYQSMEDLAGWGKDVRILL